MNANAGIFPKKDIAGIRKLKVQCLAKDYNQGLHELYVKVRNLRI